MSFDHDTIARPSRRPYRASRKAWQAERRQARQLKAAALSAFLFGGE